MKLVCNDLLIWLRVHW